MLIESCEQTFKDCFEIIKKKNADYAGPNNEWKNFETCQHIAEIPVTTGILVRILDKFSRISNLLQNKDYKVVEETIEDTINDAINYLALLKARIQFELNRESEPKQEPKRAKQDVKEQIIKIKRSCPHCQSDDIHETTMPGSADKYVCLSCWYTF